MPIAAEDECLYLTPFDLQPSIFAKICNDRSGRIIMSATCSTCTGRHSVSKSRALRYT